MEDIILTKDALEKLKEERNSLIAKRKDITARIEVALAHGDLSENFEYHEAKEAQGMNESRISELEYMIKHAQIVEKSSTGKVGMGSLVVIEVMGKQMNFEIVSFNQADPSAGKISNESPIGQALLGYGAGDEVQVTMPNGKHMTYTIISVE